MIKFLKIIPPMLTIAMSIVFLYFNPYSSTKQEIVTQAYFFGLLIFPAILVSISYIFSFPKLKIIGFILSLPLGLYIGLNAIPSLWNIFIVLLALYLIVPGEKKI